MSGKTVAILAGFFVIGIALGKAKQTAFTNQIADSKLTTEQCLNRLSEFCIDDLASAKKEFFEFMEMGFSPEESFEIVSSKVVVL
ncbi:hypothetical protein UFOVP784_146 [uncultured Caudovirales phage]|uniref:Uncharacterized protein n=1 Tax=uncultured Caudovirales phage TaxID=2100421 RepID=A0A6J5MEI8_9CAUD|nr:hypothetical protein UFOVP436_146 [uncultured Caudovirales phage]CAB4162847.1 hypothetical protein UFOVP784_146 [uncultured Caudovirales phage]